MDKLTVSYTLHIHGANNIKRIMLDVIIALIPAFLGGIYFFGISALVAIVTSIAFCVLFEYLWDKAIKKENTTGDLSAVVTGLLLALTLPSGVPLWMIVIGDAFAIIIVKCFYGGIGQNFVNPALAARAFMLACWPVAITSFPSPKDYFGIFGSGVDAISTSTPLAVIKNGGTPAKLFDLFFGYVPGSIGEVSAFLLLIGGIYLIFRKVINIVIPSTYIISVGLFGILFTDYGFLYNILTGGVILAGFFMATDYTTSPVSKKGQFVYALGAGLLTAVIRKFGGYPEGITYAILIMNIATPLIDKYIRPRKFGKAVKANG